MVNRNNNIKSSIKSTRDEMDTPVYPFKVDITSIPERKYLSGIYSLSKLSFVFILTSIILSFFLIIKSYSLKINPYFVYWDKIEVKFKRLKGIEGQKPITPIRKLTENTYLTEYFIRDYLTKTFNFSTKLVENEGNWCDCNSDDTLKNSDFLNTTKKCFVCNFSIPNIYSSFITNQKPTFDLMIQRDISQKIIILDMELISNIEVSGKKSFISNFLPKKNVRTITEYKVDFIIENSTYGKITNREVMTSYITVTGLKDYPRSKIVSAISYMFNPNYELILKNYDEMQKSELREAENEINL